MAVINGAVVLYHSQNETLEITGNSRHRKRYHLPPLSPQSDRSHLQIWARPYLKLLRSFVQVWTNDHWEDRNRLVAGFEAHYANVREAAKARGRPVLEFRVQEGWEPLCKFLNKEQPDMPFPRVNEGDWIAQYHVIIFWFRLVKSLREVLIPVILGLVAVLAAWWSYQS